MKILIAVVTCKKNAERQKILNETWIPIAREYRYDVELFDGERLGVPDDYIHLPLKAQAIFEWAYIHGYDYMLKFDDDTYMQVWHFNPKELYGIDYAGLYWGPTDAGIPKELNIEGIEEGTPNYPPGTFPHPYAAGGAVWLSRKAMKILVETPLNNDPQDDRWVGHVLAEAGIPLTPNSQFYWRRTAKIRKNILPDYAITINLDYGMRGFHKLAERSKDIPLIRDENWPPGWPPSRKWGREPEGTRRKYRSEIGL